MSRTRLIAVVLLGLVSVGVRAEEKPASLAEWAKKSQCRLPYSIAFKSQKAGYNIDEQKLGKHEGKDVLRATSESSMTTLFDGEKSVRDETTLICYELSGEGAILYAEVKRTEDGKQTHKRIERSGKGLKITTRQAGETLVRNVPMPKDTLASQRELEEWLQGDRKPGDTTTKYSADWDEADVNSKHVYTFKERKSIAWGGKAVEVAVLSVNLDGGKMEAVVLPNGHVLTAVLGGLISMRLEPSEKEARKPNGKLVDLMDVASIVLDKDLGLRARNVEALTLELSMVEDFQVPASHRQRVRPGKKATVVELLRDYRVEKPAPLTKEQKESYLKATPRLQCDEEKVRELVKKVTGEETEPLKVAGKLKTWVYENLKKSYQDNADTALEVLKSKAGDCTEHSLLFVTLARAAGLPAREVGGLGYIRDKKPMLGWHAWAEVHDGHQWVSVDPTWNQLYVDATHLKMSEGEKDLAWANVAGKMKVKVLSFKKKR